MTDFDAIYVEDLSEDVPPETAEHDPIIVRGIGEVTMWVPHQNKEVFLYPPHFQIRPVQQIQHGVPVAAHIKNRAGRVQRNDSPDKLDSEEKFANKR